MATWKDSPSWNNFEDINGGQQFNRALHPEDLNKLAENIAYLYEHSGESDTAEEWNGTGVVIAPIPQPMTFTINGTSYQMENRMTWYKWTRSEYNTDSFACVSEYDYVYEAESSNKVTDIHGNDVLGTTVITEGAEYLIKKGA